MPGSESPDSHHVPATPSKEPSQANENNKTTPSSGSERVLFSDRDKTVFQDVLRWARDENPEPTHPGMGTGDIELPSNDRLDEAITALEEDAALQHGFFSKSELTVLFESYADSLQDQAWDLDDPQNAFAFFEDAFTSIEETLINTH